MEINNETEDKTDNLDIENCAFMCPYCDEEIYLSMNIKLRDKVNKSGVPLSELNGR